MECKFDPTKCSPECKKYSMCAFMHLQEKMNFIINSLNTISLVTANLYTEIEGNKELLNKYTNDMLDLISQRRKRREGQLT